MCLDGNSSECGRCRRIGVAGAGCVEVLPRPCRRRRHQRRAADGHSRRGGPDDSGDSNSIAVVVCSSGRQRRLKTLIPTVGRYRDVSSALAIPDRTRSDRRADTRAPSLAPLPRCGDPRARHAREGVGLKDQAGRFQAMDTWWSAPGGPARTGASAGGSKHPAAIQAPIHCGPSRGGGSPALVA